MSTAPMSLDEFAHHPWTGPRLHTVDQSTTATVDQSTTSPRIESTDDTVDRLDTELLEVRGRRVSFRRAIRGLTAGVVVVVVFAMATAAIEVQRFAYQAGFATASSWALDPVVGFALIVIMVGETLLADAGTTAPRYTSLVRHFCGAITLTMNCWPSWHAGHWDGVLLHAVMPTLLIGFAELAPRFRRKIADQIRQLVARERELLAQRREHLEALATAAVEQERQHQLELHHQAVAERTARQAEERERAWRKQEAEKAAAELAQQESDRRIAEARELARIETEKAAAIAAAEAEQNRRPAGPRSSAKKATSPRAGSNPPPSQEKGVELILELMRDPAGPEVFALDWETLAAEHGGSRSWWMARLPEARKEFHRASSTAT